MRETTHIEIVLCGAFTCFSKQAKILFPLQQAMSLKDVLKKLDSTLCPGIYQQCVVSNDELSKDILIFINGKAISQELRTPVETGNSLIIMTAVSGG